MTLALTDLLAGLETSLRLEELLADLAARFLNHPTIQGVEAELTRAQRLICELLQFDRSTLWHLVRPHAQLLQLVQPADLPSPPPRMDAAEHLPWLLGRVRSGETVLLSSLDDLPPEAVRDRDTLAYFGTRSTAVLPLRADGRVFAALTFATVREERAWTPDLVRRLELVAQLFASALLRSDADATLREVTGRLINAQERERARLAQELHDGLSQQIAVLAVELQLLGRRPPSHPAAYAGQLEELAGKAKALASDVHRLAHGLLPAKLEHLGLVPALAGLCRELGAAENLGIRFVAENVTARVPPTCALSLYRVAQEALWNVVKHSGARHAAVTLRGTPGELQLEVADDGRGFDPEDVAASASLGLLGMRERVAVHGGGIRWDRVPGSGTAVRAHIPLPLDGDA